VTLRQLTLRMDFSEPAAKITDARCRPDLVARPDVLAFDAVEQCHGEFGSGRQDRTAAGSGFE
jgi:hypothetical protein